MWFECKVRYEKPSETDAARRVAEAYLVDALSFTEAEARITAEIMPYCPGGVLEVTDIKRARYAELFPSEAERDDRWFKVKLSFITLDEKTSEEKRTAQQVLVQAADLRRAVTLLDEGMKGSMADYEIIAVNETPIMDVFSFGEAKSEE